jgi:Ca2+-binding RTX toxin-like protein
MPIVSGTASDDILSGTSGDDSISGYGGNDFINGGDGNDMLDGGDDHDDVRGGNGNDIILAGNGDDLLYGNSGDDFLDGGAGFDRVGYYSGATAGVTVDLTLQGAAQDTGQGFDTLVGIEHVSGTAFSDTLIGDNGDNVLWGSAATLIDGVIASTNNDMLIGGGGHDLLIAGIGNHSIDGGSGIDTFRFTENGASETGITLSLLLQGSAQTSGNGSWTLSGIENLSGSISADNLTGDGNDNVLAGDLGDDTLSGGAGNDTLYGDGQINWDTHGTGRSGPIVTYADATGLYVGAVPGNDTLEGGLGNDQLHGGGGIDTASYASAGGGVFAFLYDGGFGEAFGGDGYDQLHGIENLTGSAFNDALYGNSLDNLVSGGGGHDDVRGGGGNDLVYGGAGDDLLYGNAGDDLLDGGDGFDRVGYYSGAAAGVTVDLGLQGVAQNTGQGWDTLVGIENVSGTVYQDTITGDGNDNVLWGAASTVSPGNVATTNNDTISGGGGNDLLILGIGNHVVDGGSGIDTFRFTENGAGETGITLSLMLQGSVQASGNGNWALTGIENLSGSTADDSLTGDGNANVLAGDLGDDSLSGGAGDDTLYGDGQINWDTHGAGRSGPTVTYTDATSLYAGAVPGNDLLEGGLGNDHLDGGGGIDRATYANACGSVAVNLEWGSATGADGEDTLANIEDLTGSEFGDVLTGSSAANAIDGLSGNDIISGKGGDDALDGGAGDDQIWGDAGNDTIDGGAGRDVASYSLPAGTIGSLEAIQAEGAIVVRLVQADGSFEELFSVVVSGTGAASVTGLGSMAALGTDTISNVEELRFVIDTFPAPPTEGQVVHLNLAVHVGSFITGSVINDVIDLNDYPGVTNVHAGFGDDTIIGRTSSNDALRGEAGNDTIIGNASNADYDLAAFALPAGMTGTLRVVAGTGADVGRLIVERVDGVTVERLFIVSIAENGIATVQGVSSAAFLGTDSVSGVDALDFILGNGPNQYVTIRMPGVWTAGANLIGGTGQSDLVALGEGDDQVRGNAGDDVLLGGGGDDFFRGGTGIDYFNGGSGFDRISFFETAAIQAVVADLRTGLITNDGFGNAEIMVGIEGLGGGTAFPDTFYGNDDANFILVDVGDTARSFGGDDSFQLGSAPALVDGGAGFDIVRLFNLGYLVPDENADGLADSIAPAAAGFVVDLRTGTIRDGYGNSGTIIGIEAVFGSELGDSLTGSLGNDQLSGGGGDDLIDGVSGSDDSVLYLLPGGAGETLSIVEGTGAQQGMKLVVLTSGTTSTTLATVGISGGTTSVTGLGAAAYLGVDTLTNIDRLVFTTVGGASVELSIGSGLVVDGLIAGATVFMDANENGILDSGESFTTSAADGSFSFLSLGSGPIVALGGTNSDTGLPNLVTLSAPKGSSIVNPLTTLVQKVLEQGGADTAEEAASIVASAFGIAPELDLLNLDLVGAAAAGNEAALDAQKVAVQIVALIVAARDAGSEEAAATVLSNLAALAGASAEGEVVDLSDSETLTEALAGAIPPDAIETLIETLAQTNIAIGNSESLEELTRTQAVALTQGNDLDNVLEGGDQADSLSGFGGNDSLKGKAGNDTLDGGTGADTMVGGVGDDLYFVDNPGDLVTEAWGEGTDSVSSSISYTLTAEVEDLTLTGSAANGAGNGLDNVITGNAASNRLNGGGGNDRLVGGDGVDYFTGGAGADTFVGEINATKIVGKGGSISVDVILDYQAGVDKIDLSGIDANTNIAGNQAFAWTKAANPGIGELSIRHFGNMNAAEAALGFDIDGVEGSSSYAGPVAIVLGNVDGGAADFMIVFTGTEQILTADFVL